MRSGLAVLLAGLLAATGAAAAPIAVVLPGYDAIFPGRCAVNGNPFACEQAVPEIRNGDGGTSAAQAEWNNGPNTGAPASVVNITGRNAQTQIWNGTPYAFSLAYDSVTDLLRLGVNLGDGQGFRNADYTVDLAPSRTMYIRAVSRNTTAPDTVLSNLVLNGFPLGTLTAGSNAPSLEISNFNWNQPWTLTGSIAMSRVDTSNSRPSVQFKLTYLDPVGVPEPAALALLATGLFGLAALAVARRRRA